MVSNILKHQVWYSDSIGKFLPDKERPDEGVFSFKDENKWLSFTIRSYRTTREVCNKNFLEIPKPFKDINSGLFGETKNQAQVDSENFAIRCTFCWNKKSTSRC